MKRQADAVIRDAVLRKIVGANFFFASTRADLAPALRAVFLRLFALVSLQQPRSQDRYRSFFVFDLAAAVLTAHHHTRRNVQDLHGLVGRVDALPASTSGGWNITWQ